MNMFVDEKILFILEQEKLILNFANKNRSDNEILELFGTIDNIIRFDDSWKMAHILHAAGIFSSISDARKAGWNHDIKQGWQQCWDEKLIRKGFDSLATAAIVGKGVKRKAIWVFN